MTMYTFSYYTKRPVPHIKRRPWWNLFGTDSIEYKEQWERVEISRLTEDEGRLLLEASSNYWDVPLGTLLLRILGLVYQAQLEVDGPSKSYVICGMKYAHEGALK